MAGTYDELQTKPKQRKYMPSQYAKQKLTGSWMVKTLAQMSEILLAQSLERSCARGKSNGKINIA